MINKVRRGLLCLFPVQITTKEDSAFFFFFCQGQGRADERVMQKLTAGSAQTGCNEGERQMAAD